jgi:hypothetical protein
MELSAAEWKQIVLMAWAQNPCTWACDAPACKTSRAILKLNEKHYPKDRRTWTEHKKQRGGT